MAKTKDKMKVKKTSKKDKIWTDEQAHDFFFGGAFTSSQEKKVKPQEKINRKEYPVFSGVLKYFPKAIMYISHVSFVGNEQHNKGEPLHWDRTKSTDEPDALVRHLLQAGEIDDDGLLHSGKVAWRSLALLEKELEKVEKKYE
jgi:hypothetical protein